MYSSTGVEQCNVAASSPQQSTYAASWWPAHHDSSKRREQRRGFDPRKPASIQRRELGSWQHLSRTGTVKGGQQIRVRGEVHCVCLGRDRCRRGRSNVDKPGSSLRFMRDALRQRGRVIGRQDALYVNFIGGVHELNTARLRWRWTSGKGSEGPDIFGRASLLAGQTRPGKAMESGNSDTREREIPPGKCRLVAVTQCECGSVARVRRGVEDG
ncbi:uncharacterized protein LAESUDRAFT_714913 [Laetiporus sulphureus 93-53]|uniref:Uncharacterized protein n=1 Tax=Laetiporus sulphureus 93-53 TaxID=1314785 RepID=A0A165DPU5_9APHY|nr:uncharacterized protein LAESUDRAFT_714913 [Laetiporus sulphureus 93-53]KZT05365.1 hypothetical protein LAESUDRAFT_714913 [Laetiporus sulphureus 93-53]